MTNKREAIFFPEDKFAFGGTLVSTMTRRAHNGQSLEEWKKELFFDLERMAAHGMTAVVIMMDWEKVEPRENEFDFSYFDPLLEKAADLGLRVALWPWEEETMPDWLPRRYPECLWEADDGARPPFGSWHHPLFRNLVHRFLRTVVERYRNSPALCMWNIAIEPHYRISGLSRTLTEQTARVYCYNPASIERYREWLKKRHAGDLDSLNRRWLAYYGDWNEVEPPRYNLSNFHSPRFFDWRLFWVDALAEYQGGKARLVKELDPVHPTTGNSGWILDPILSGMGVQKVADCLDSFGISIFPIYGGGRMNRISLHRWHTFISSVSYPDKPYFVHELQGGPMAAGLVLGETPDPGEVSQWCWQAVGHGYQGIFFWSWRPHRAGTETGGFGLCRLDGTDTERTKAADETGRKLQNIAPLLRRVKPVRPEVAILHSDLNAIFNFTAAKVAGDMSLAALHNDSIKGYYALFYELGIPVHFMADEQLAELTQGNLNHIKFLVIPYMPLLDEAAIKNLTKFAQRGGVIWSDPWLGERTSANVSRDTTPGDELASLFGCIHGEVRPILKESSWNSQNAWRGHSVIDKSGCRLIIPGMDENSLVSFLHEIALQPDEGAEVLGVFQNGEPALIRKKYGKSTVYYTGSFFSIDSKPTTSKPRGMAAQKPGNAESGLLALFKRLLADMDIRAPVRPLAKGYAEVETYLLAGRDESLVIFINHGPESVNGTWEVEPGFSDVKNLTVSDLCRKLPVKADSGRAGVIELTLDLPRYGVAAVHCCRTSINSGLQ